RLSASSKGLGNTLAAASGSASAAATAQRELAQRVDQANALLQNQARFTAQNGDAVIALSDQMQRLLARYDPLGAKLRSLQADFANLNREVASGAGAGQESAIDKTYAALNAEIAKTRGLMQQAGVVEGFTAQADAADRSAFATAQARRELIV